MNEEQIIADDGFYFGIGVFETVAVENGVPQFVEEHIRRMMRSLVYFDIGIHADEIYSLVETTLDASEIQQGRQVLKIAVSSQNKVASIRSNPYSSECYDRGFRCDISAVRRNETSPLVFHKTLNYGDNIMEKRAAKKRGIDEPLFLNSKGLLSEGATTNVFVMQGDSIVTPPLKSGLLPGIMREYVCRMCDVEQREITYEEALESDEMFLTNSLLGIMPVCALGDRMFDTMKKSRELRAFCMDGLKK